MDDDQLFRWIVVAEIGTLLPIMAYHRAMAHRKDEKLDRRQEGIFMLVALRVGGALCFGAFLASLFQPRWFAWATVALPNWLRWMGVSFLALAGVIIVWAFHNLGKNLTDTVVTRKDSSLVVTGPYRWVRHPFYLGMILFVCGISLAMTNWYFFVTGVVVLSLLIIRTRTEEEKLIERFGDDYRQYMQRTPRFVPRFLR